MRPSLTLHVLRFLPRNLLSRVFGRIAAIERPRCVPRALNRFWVRHFDVTIAEAERPVEDYASLLDFFTRRLRPGARSVAADADALVSPVDGALGACGRIRGDRLIQAKGLEYRLDALLGSAKAAATYANGWFATLYLAPRDYHRIHAPVDGAIVAARYEPGTLWPVNAVAVHRIPSLFAVNERVTLELSSAHGPLAMALVGATNVGSIRLEHVDLVTNRGRPRETRTLEPPARLVRGDEVGVFALGSSVVLLVAAKDFAFELEEGASLRMGEVLGRFARGEPRPAAVRHGSTPSATP